MRRLAWPAAIGALLITLCGAASRAPTGLRFVILGDRTGEAQPGVYEQVWREIAAEKPALVLSVGDTIQGLDDRTADGEWWQIEALWKRYASIPLYLTPGNHDIWSPYSERLFTQAAGKPPHYSFDIDQMHVTVLDNSRTEQLSDAEMTFLQHDLAAHEKQPLKLIVSHRPTWLMSALLTNSHAPLHQLAKRFHVKYVIAGHLHEMLRFEFDGVTYISMPSAGGHLRGSKRYEDGWFFGHAIAGAKGDSLDIHIEEAKPPIGNGRVTVPAEWGSTGLVKRPSP